MIKQIIHSKKHGNKVVIVDNRDEWIFCFRWSLIKTNRNFYCTARFRITKGVYATIIMSRMILNVTDNKFQVDHRNHNGIDNRRKNLRVCSKDENCKNRSSYGASKYLGVTYHKPTNQWKARIFKNGKEYYIGLFKSEAAAAKAYDIKAKLIHKKFANLNFK